MSLHLVSCGIISWQVRTAGLLEPPGVPREEEKEARTGSGSGKG